MEPLTTAAIAVGSVVSTKALKKIGEKVGEALFDKTSKFLESLKKQSPNTVAAIEKASEEPLDYGETVIEVASAAQAEPGVAQAMQDVAEEAKTNPPSNLAEVLEKIKEAVEKSQHSYPPTFTQNIQKAINAASHTQVIDQRESTFNF